MTGDAAVLGEVAAAAGGRADPRRPRLRDPSRRPASRSRPSRPSSGTSTAIRAREVWSDVRRPRRGHRRRQHRHRRAVRPPGARRASTAATTAAAPSTTTTTGSTRRSVCGNPSLAPCDNNGHGTHTMGTMVGDDGDGANQIGVAPGAKWIAAKGCETQLLLRRGAARRRPVDARADRPDRRQPAPRPAPAHRQQLVGRQPVGDPWYQATVAGLGRRGHLPGLLQRQRRPGLRHRRLARRLPRVSYSVGAFDINNAIASFSSRGPSAWTATIKPNIAAPGVNVRSVRAGNGYGSFSGTSMASPHVGRHGRADVVGRAGPRRRRRRDPGAPRRHRDRHRRTSRAAAPPTTTTSWARAARRVRRRRPVAARPDRHARPARSPTPRRRADRRGRGRRGRTGRPDRDDRRRRHVLADRCRSATTRHGVAVRLPRPAPPSVTITEGQTTVAGLRARAGARARACPVTSVDEGRPTGRRRTVTIVGTPIPPATTDADGAYSFPSVPDGSTTSRVDAGGCFGAADPAASSSTATRRSTSTLPRRADSFGYTCRGRRRPATSRPTRPSAADRRRRRRRRAPAVPVPVLRAVRTPRRTCRTNGLVNFLAASTVVQQRRHPERRRAERGDLPVLGRPASSTARRACAPSCSAPRRTGSSSSSGATSASSATPAGASTSRSCCPRTGTIRHAVPQPRPPSRASGAARRPWASRTRPAPIALQYSFNAAVLSATRQSRPYRLPPSAFVAGAVTDANDGEPVAGADGAGGAGPGRRPPGDHRRERSVPAPRAARHVHRRGQQGRTTSPAAAPVTVDQEDATVVQDFALHTARGDGVAGVAAVHRADRTRTRHGRPVTLAQHRHVAT